MSDHIKSHLALFAVAVIYGANFTIAKELLDDDHILPYGLTLLRVSSGLLLFWLSHTLYIKEKIGRGDHGRLLLCGITGVAVNQMLFIAGLKYTTQINAALIMTTTPILVLAASWLILKEIVAKKKLLGIALGVLGAILLIICGKEFALRKHGMLGDLMVFVNAFSYGIYLVIVRNLMRKYHPVTVTMWVFFYGLFFVLPFGFHELTIAPMNMYTPRLWLALAYVLICTTFLAYLFNSFALKHVSPSVVSIYIYLQPVIATAIALSLGKDVLTEIKVAAGALIFTGVFLVSKR